VKYRSADTWEERPFVDYEDSVGNAENITIVVRATNLENPVRVICKNKSQGGPGIPGRPQSTEKCEWLRVASPNS